MKKYKLGLLLLAVLVLGLAVYTMVLASGSKQDKKTEAKDQEISTALNSYVTEKDKIPASLDEAGVNDVPNSIKYKKLSDEEYQVCVTYKSAGNMYQSIGLSPFSLLNFTSMYGNINASMPESTSRTVYYPGYSHKKGENCQTVKPYTGGTKFSYPTSTSTNSSSSSSTNTPSSSGSSSSIDDYTADLCKPTSQYYDLYKDYCVNGKLDYSKFSTN